MNMEARETSAPKAAPLERSGLLVVHGNRAERLLELALQWNARSPLPPLESDTWLVPSQGVGQWVQQTLAAGPDGIAAGLDLRLPAQWLWQAYRALLGDAGVPATAPLDEGPLTWRLWRLLPELMADNPQGVYATLAAYLTDDPDGRKRGQLAQRLADLFDQYQVYRPDWLADWAAGHDTLRDAHGRRLPLPEPHRWQAALWRAAQADALSRKIPAPFASRADIHGAFVEAAHRHPDQPPPPGLPRRLTVFGVASLPPATLEALALVARWSQVLVCVLNPCRYHWTDGMPDAATGHPLLTAWGRQGRDFMALLQAHEERPVRDRFDAALQALGSRIELFESPVADGQPGTLLTQLQDDILNGRPLAESRLHWPAVDPTRDDSLRFHICHTPLREVEVLHDQVLAALHRDPTLQPRDILVMVPDVEAYAPFVHAVFGGVAPGDPRHIPYAVSDTADDAGQQLLQVLRGLLALPRGRLTASDVLGWLECPALARRFGVRPVDGETLQRWLAEAGVRWGLDGQHRRQLGLAAPDDPDAERLTWRDGLRRLWLGYALGPEDGDWQAQVPARGVSTLDAALINRLQALIDTLERHARALAEPTQAPAWVERLQALLADCFDEPGAAADPAEARALQRMRSALHAWAAEAADAGEAPLPLPVVADAWLARAAPPAAGQRFLGGALTFATLMPMRAVPFRHIHLLGLHDSAYPRRQPADDFDLTAAHPRPGDRLRRHEDHYLFLEALLSARERLSVSWVGRSPVDDSVRAPSVLVGQLRDHVTAGWQHVQDGESLMDALTTTHGLQPFDTRYFRPNRPGVVPADGPPAPGARWFSYAHEWLPRVGELAPGSPLPAWAPEEPTDTAALAQFLRHPVRAFYEQRLQVRLSRQDADDPDHEPFAPDGLDRWTLDDAWVRALVGQARAGRSSEDGLAAAEAVWRRAVWRGAWPGGPFGTALAGDWHESAQRLWRVATAFAARHPALDATPETLDETFDDEGIALRVTDVLGPVARAADGTRALLVWQGSAIVESQGTRGQPKYRHAKLLEAWVRHLAHHRAGGPVQTWVISPRGDAMLAPLDPDAAQAAWHTLLRYWLTGMTAPCPLEPTAGVRYLQRLDRSGPAEAWRAARESYEGDEFRAGTLSRDPYWRLAFPDFAALAGPADAVAASAFARAADALLRPLMQAVTRPPLDDAENTA